jgi:hypothetical protein
MISDTDAHLLARVVQGDDLNGEVASMSPFAGMLAEKLLSVPANDRTGALARIVADLPDGGAVREAIVRADPDGPGPAEEADEPIADDWPAPPSRGAYHGIAGRLVELVGPHSEADPAAVLFSFLTCFGILIGRLTHQLVGSTRHCGNINVCLVGPSGRGRKGTSADLALARLEQVDGEWVRARVAGGLSTGEGLVYHVRDEQKGSVRVKEKGKPPTYHEVIVDPGVKDKRQLCLETEFAGVLRKLGREGNCLSAVIRQAYDGDRLASLTKGSPLRATGAHVGLLCHTTREDLLRHLSDTDTVNGFSNRILWPCARRSKLLPDGGRLDTVDFGPIDRGIAEAFEFAQKGELSLRRSDDARDLWREHYPSLTRSRPGLYGAVTGRAEAMVLRLSGLYAVLDCSADVMVEHVQAALAAWDYCERSARYIFGDRLADADADRLYRAIREAPEGLRRNQIGQDVFQGNKPAKAIDALLASLLADGLIRPERVPTAGRAATRFVAL